MKSIGTAALGLALLLLSCSSPAAGNDPAPVPVMEDTTGIGQAPPVEDTRNPPPLDTAPASPGEQSSIVGVWVSEEDSLWKMEFTADNRCINYYEEELNDSSTWSISNTSPQCGIEAPVEANTSYLQLTGLQDGQKMCYEINGISQTHLSLRYLERGGASVFTRQ